MTLNDALQAACRRGLPLNEARMLLLHLLGRPTHDRAWLLAHGGDALPAAAARPLRHCTARRLAGEPMAYLTGHKHFHGLRLQTDARALDPRDDTETLVDWALELLPGGPPAPSGPPTLPGGHAPAPAAPPATAGAAAPAAPPRLPPAAAPLRVLDLGTGSGAVALAIARQRPAAQVSATDASASALALARANAHQLGLPVHFVQGDWLAPMAGRAFHLIVSNPPYIAEGDPHLVALRHEPRAALVSGPDGLQDLRRIIRAAPAHLLPGGWLLLEHGWDQAPPVRALLAAAGFAQVQSRRDLAGVPRCSGGQMPG